MTASIRRPVVLATAIATALIAAPLHAEEGDYSFWQTLANLDLVSKLDGQPAKMVRPSAGGWSRFARAMKHWWIREETAGPRTVAARTASR